MKLLSYAYPDPELREPFAAPSMWERVNLWRRTLRSSIGRERPTDKIEIHLVNQKAFRPLLRGDLGLIVLSHDDSNIIDQFLQHYRDLGVTRFIVLDDQSRDDTPEYLSSQPDVDLWTSNVRYGAALRGRIWREMLFEMYGRGRWYLNVDSDEFLVFEGSDQGRKLPDFIRSLQSLGVTRCPAPMLDMYNPGAIEEAKLRRGIRPDMVATHYDASGYVLFKGPSSLNIRGGVRQRIFDAKLDLMKYPLMLVDNYSSMGKTIHQPLPLVRNFSPIYGMLLHFKIFSDLKEVAARAAVDEQYYSGAREYKRILNKDDLGGMILLADCSIRYSGPSDLIRRGFMVNSA